MNRTDTQQHMQDCIDLCQRCHATCLEMAMTHCLQLGGPHTEPEHFQLMINCADMCETTANFMLSQSVLHEVICAACAQVCHACADSCEDVGNMDECVRVCRRCAQSCEQMSGAARSVQAPGMQTQQPRL